MCRVRVVFVRSLPRHVLSLPGSAEWRASTMQHTLVHETSNNLSDASPQCWRPPRRQVLEVVDLSLMVEHNSHPTRFKAHHKQETHKFNNLTVNLQASVALEYAWHSYELGRRSCSHFGLANMGKLIPGRTPTVPTHTLLRTQTGSWWSSEDLLLLHLAFPPH